MIPKPLKELNLRQLEWLLAQSHKKRRSIVRARRRWVKLYSKIEHDFVTVYPNQPAADIVARLSNQDLAWQGDFDVIRPDLSNLLDKLLQLGALPEETSRVLVALDYMAKRGPIIND